MKRKPYKNIDAVPRDKWNLPILCLRRGREDKAEKLLLPILAKIQDIKQFEVFMLVRKLKVEAGILPSVIYTKGEENNVFDLQSKRLRTT